MGLKEYLRKRNLKKSGEPKAIKVTPLQKGIFVIQEHHASHLHWDLRLSMDGVLKSWALPKEPPRRKNLKRLAVHVEDHPLGYANFEGEIKEGYGKGTVKIWDKGTYKLEENFPEKLIFEMKGKKMKGKYALIKTKFKGQEKKSWLFMKI